MSHSLRSLVGHVVSWLFLALALLLIVLQYTTLTKFAVLPPSASYLTFARFFAAVQEQVAFSWGDGLLVSALGLVLLGLIGCEVRSAAVSKWLQYFFESEQRALGLLVCASLLSVRFYFAPGELNWAGDASHHIATADIAAQAIRAGEIPIWTFYIGGGSPYLQNYGFLFFYWVGLVDLLCGDIFLSLKLVLAFAHVLSGVGMYVFARRLFAARRAAFVAGLAYVLCFWHVQHVLIMGRLPLALFYGLLPWVFAAVETLLANYYKMAAAAVGGVLLALLAFAHPGYGAWAFIFLAVYAAIRLSQAGGRADRRRSFWASGLLFAWGVLASSYMSIGMWAEKHYTNLHDFSPGIKSAANPEQIVPDPTWLHVLSWSNFRFWLWPPEPFHWYGGYMGVSLFALAAVAVAFFFFAAPGQRPRPLAAGLGCLLLAWSLVFAYRYPPLNWLQLIQAFNASRFLLFFSFFLSLAAGFGCFLLLRYRAFSARRSRIFALVVGVVLVDLGSTTFLHPYRSDESTPTGLPDEIFSGLRSEGAAAALPTYRAQWIADDVHRALSIGQMLFLGRVPTLEAFHPGELRAFDDFTGPFSDLARKVLMRIEDPGEFATDAYAGLLEAGFFLANTRYVLVTSQRGFGYVLPFAESAPIAVAPRVVAYADAMVDSIKINALIARDLDLASADSLDLRRIKSLLWTLSGMELRPWDLACERIYIRDCIRDCEEEVDLQTTPTAQVLEHVVGHRQVNLRVRVSQACYARLSYAYFPFLHVSVDGQRVEPLQTAGRFMAVKLAAGEHEIAIVARLSALRLALLWAALAGGGIAALLVYGEYKKSPGSKLES